MSRWWKILIAAVALLALPQAPNHAVPPSELQRQVEEHRRKVEAHQREVRQQIEAARRV